MKGWPPRTPLAIERDSYSPAAKHIPWKNGYFVTGGTMSEDEFGALEPRVVAAIAVLSAARRFVVAVRRSEAEGWRGDFGDVLPWPEFEALEVALVALEALND